jgi:hypothetical protein
MSPSQWAGLPCLLGGYQSHISLNAGLRRMMRGKEHQADVTPQEKRGRGSFEWAYVVRLRYVRLAVSDM